MIRFYVAPIVTLLLLASNPSAIGQCVGGSSSIISAESQEELEELFTDYNGDDLMACSVAGLVDLSGVSDISLLAGLEKVEGRLWIHDSPGLTSLAGLESLKEVQWLIISGCENLEDMSALAAVTTIETDFSFSSNGKVAVFEMPSLTSVDRISIGSCASLETVNLDHALESIDQIIISQNPELTSIVGPNEIENLGLDGPYGNGGLQCDFNDKLQSISGFMGTREAGAILIRGADDASSYPNIQAFSGVQRVITIDIHNVSATNFGSLQEVDYLTLWFNQGNVAPFSSLTKVNHNLAIENTELEFNPEFPVLQEVGENLTIQSNQSMTAFTGMNALTTIGGWFDFGFNAFETFSGVEQLASIGQFLRFDNYQMTQCNGFNTLSTVGDYFEVSGNKVKQLNAFESLSQIGGDFRFTFNDSVRQVNGFYNIQSIGGNASVRNNRSLSDCAVFCPLLAPGVVGGTISISNNLFPCEQSVLEAQCATRLVDANPTLISTWLGQQVEDIRNLAAADIPELGLDRRAVAADGVTEVVIINEFGEPGQFDYTVDGEPLEKPWGPSTIEINDKHFGFAIFRAPEVFPGDGVDMEEYATVNIAFSGAQVTEYTYRIPLVRPPVLLVHGTFDNPDNAWKTPADGGAALYDFLTFKGYHVFTADYRSTNGSSDGSSFSDNAQMLWENEGDGIKDALTHYRDDMQWACTQADVVGHSMGGILARVYASDFYNQDPGYKRPENFMQGDINRLITLGSTHFGSNLAEFKVFLETRSIFSEPVAWAEGQAAALISSYITDAGTTDAVKDQVPPGPDGAGALANIGATPVPAHAIASAVSRGMLADMQYDPDSSYYKLYRYMALGMYYAGALRESLVAEKRSLCDAGLCPGTDMDGDPVEIFDGLSEDEVFELINDQVDDVLQQAGAILELLDGEYELPSEIDVLSYLLAEAGMGDVADPLLQYLNGADPTDIFAEHLISEVKAKINDYLESSESKMFQEEMIETLRFLIFNNDENDGTVRVESQTGELEEKCPDCVKVFENALHSFLPRYPEIQLHILELLDSGMARFDSTGFEAPDHAQPFYYPAYKIDLYKEAITGDAAICNSGMLPLHALAFAKVAQEENVVIVSRPVNPDGLPLLEDGAATKKMDVKPKSGNWGPQMGYLPVNQRYSKIPMVFPQGEWADKVLAYNAKAQGNLEDSVTLKRHLQIEMCNGPYWVYIDHNKNEGDDDPNLKDEVVLVPVSRPDQVCQWDHSKKFSTEDYISDCGSISDKHNLEPLFVMASREFSEANGTPRYLTADYDLLMIGFYNGENNPYDPPTDIEFMEGVGQITSEQTQLLQKLNSKAAHEGGDLSHHGPENQFSESPYIDYPLTVFTPSDPEDAVQNGQIMTITMGPPGFRDINLKRFVNDMRDRGYDLYDNTAAPGWKWTWNEGIGGFELVDDEELAKYVAQLPLGACSKYNVDGTCADKPEYSSDTKPTAATGNGNSLTINPNPVAGNAIIVNTGIDTDWYVLDQFGQVLDAGNSNGTPFEIDVSKYAPGLYYLRTGSGVTERFIKL